MSGKRLLVRVLGRACLAVDAVAYRPAVVRLTLPLPRWWDCELGRLSVRLDRRWSTGYWGDWAPGQSCAACGRRAAWLVVGGRDEDADDSEGPWDREVEVCSWCDLSPYAPISTEEELREALGAAREASVSWRWRPA